MCQDREISVYVYDVYDGDTINILMLSDGNRGTVVKIAVRILGIDTPEIRGGAGRLPEEKIAGELARDHLAELLSTRASKSQRPKAPVRARLTRVILRDWDMYGGRVLGNVLMPDGRSVSEIMIAAGYAREYFGDKKQPWTREDLSKHPFNISAK
jgi:endonuclease YncB( thermonuclease family)